MDKIKTWFIALFTALSAWLGVLYVPMMILVIYNIVDYGTGIAAAKNRGKKVSSEVGLQGISKKICMWLLVGIGAIIDWLLTYAAEQVGIPMTIKFAVAILVVAWLICNEIISILENISDIGTPLPSFLMKIVKNLKSQVENKAEQGLPKKTENMKNIHT